MLILVALVIASPCAAAAQSASEPLVIGETFTIRSAALDETRRINVYLPAPYSDSGAVRLPVLYMPDGGMAEDFLHVAGLVQVSVGNGTMRPFILVGIENTQRRRDLTGPTDVPSDREIAPTVGGSARFRRFIRTELMPAVRSRYRTTGEAGIVGESLAGLFVLETLVLEPDLFDTYIAFDPSLWWNAGSLIEQLQRSPRALSGRTVYIANSGEPAMVEMAKQFADLLAGRAGVASHFESMPGETHATIYHPAALEAFRMVFRVPPT